MATRSDPTSCKDFRSVLAGENFRKHVEIFMILKPTVGGVCRDLNNGRDSFSSSCDLFWMLSSQSLYWKGMARSGRVWGYERTLNRSCSACRNTALALSAFSYASLARTSSLDRYFRRSKVSSAGPFATSSHKAMASMLIL